MKKLLLCFSIFLSTSILLFAQKTISGIVKNENGESLIGTNIIWDGESGIGTVSNVDGSFSINLPEQKGNLTFMYIGYASASIDISRISNLPITLLKETQDAPEVDMANFIKKDKPKTIKTFEQDDRKDNVFKTESGNTIIKLRNVNSGEDSGVMIVIDGVEQEGKTEEIMKNIDRTTIKNMDVYKGDKAIELFGKKGKNGVVVITSKDRK